MKISSSWNEFSATDFCDSVRDGTHDSPKFHGEGRPLVTSKAIKGGRLMLEAAGLISERDFQEINKRSKVDKWDILFTMIGTLGEVYLEKSDEVDYAIKNIGVFKCGEELKARWLYHWFRSPDVRAALLQLRRGASQQYISLGTLRSLLIRFPKDTDLANRIVKTISAYDDLIENNQRRIALLEEAARQLYKEWFVRFRFPGHEHVEMIDGVPEEWRRSRVADLGLVVTGKTPSKKVEENFGSDVPFIKTPDMHGQTFIVANEEWLSERGANSQHNKTLPAGSVLVSCIGTIGVVAMTIAAAQTNQQINAVIPRHSHWQFFTYFVLEAIKSKLEAMGGGATMANVSKSKLEGVPITIAKDSLILGFDDQVRPMFDLIESLAKQNIWLAKSRDLLLPKLMSGAIAA